MKYYILKLLTTRSGIVTVYYRDDKNLHEFNDELLEKHGTFYQLHIDEFEETPSINKVYELKESESVDIKPFMTTYSVYKKHGGKLEITSTVHGMNTCVCTMKEFMLAERSGNYSMLNWNQ